MSVETYKLRDIDTAAPVEFDRRFHLPPDAVSESLAGYDGLQAAHAWQVINASNPELRYRSLVPGVGVGTLACAFAAYERRYQMLGSRSVEIDGFDVDGSAVDFAQRNFGRLKNSRFSAHFYQADWSKQQTWDALRPNSYHLILVNPPYLPREEVDSVAEDYRTVPAATLDGGTDGLKHFRTILPQLPRLIDREHGGTVLFRFQTPGKRYIHELQEIMKDAFGEDGTAWPSGLFPSEGQVSVKPDASGRTRWISFGRIVVPAQ